MCKYCWIIAVKLCVCVNLIIRTGCGVMFKYLFENQQNTLGKYFPIQCLPLSERTLLFGRLPSNFMHFKIKNSHDIDFLNNFGNANVTSRYDIKCLGLTLDNLLDWKVHFNNIYSKLSTSSYTIRISKQILS